MSDHEAPDKAGHNPGAPSGWKARFFPGIFDPEALERAANFDDEEESTELDSSSSADPSADIDAAAAVRIAREHLRALRALEGARGWDGFEVEFGTDPEFTVADGASIRFTRALPRSGESQAPLPPLTTLWAAYVVPRRIAFTSSTVILVSKKDGTVVYFGSANDEG